MGRRSDIDWDAVHRDYRIGQLTIAEVAKKHGVALSGLKKKAKEKGWKRDLTPVVQLATKAAITQERADHAKELAEKAPEIGREIGRSIAQAANSGLDQDVAAAAALGTMRNRVHADIADEGITVAKVILANLLALSDKAVQEELRQSINPEDEAAKKRLERVLAIPEMARTLDTTLAAAAKAVGIDRKANGLDDKDAGKDSGYEDMLRSIAETAGQKK